jgi:hypothetical protein
MSAATDRFAFRESGWVCEMLVLRTPLPRSVIPSSSHLLPGPRDSHSSRKSDVTVTVSLNPFQQKWFIALNSILQFWRS